MSSPYDPSQQQTGQPGPPTPMTRASSRASPAPAPIRPAARHPAAAYPPGGGAPAPYGQSYGVATQEHPQGTTILVLGIVGIFVGVCAPIAWYMGSKAQKEIAASGQPLHQRAEDQHRQDHGHGVHDHRHRLHRALHRLCGRCRWASWPRRAKSDAHQRSQRGGGRAVRPLRTLRRDLHRARRSGCNCPGPRRWSSRRWPGSGWRSRTGAALSSVVGGAARDRRTTRRRSCCCGPTWTRCR